MLLFSPCTCKCDFCLEPKHDPSGVQENNFFEDEEAPTSKTENEILLQKIAEQPVQLETTEELIRQANRHRDLTCPRKQITGMESTLENIAYLKTNLLLPLTTPLFPNQMKALSPKKPSTLNIPSGALEKRTLTSMGSGSYCISARSGDLRGRFFGWGMQSRFHPTRKTPATATVPC